MKPLNAGSMRAGAVGGARKEFIQIIKRLADDVRAGGSPSECWRAVDREVERLDRRVTKVRRQVR